MLLLVRTIVEAPEAGWGSPETIGAFALSLALLAAFVAIERRTSAPLVRLGILRTGPLVRANLGMMTLFGAYVGFQFVMTLYLQALNGWSPVETALAFLPARAARGRRVAAARARSWTASGAADDRRRRASRRFSATPSSCGSTRFPTTPRCSCRRSS